MISCDQRLHAFTVKPANKALHRTAIPLRSIAAGGLCRYAARGIVK